MIGESQNIQSSVLSNRLEDDAPIHLHFLNIFSHVQAVIEFLQ